MFIGAESIALPEFDLGSSSADTIQVWSLDENVEVSVDWQLHFDEHVELRITRVNSQPRTSEVPEVAGVVVILACDTRMHNIIPLEEYLSTPSPQTDFPMLGDEAGCEALDGPIGDTEVAYQVIRQELMVHQSLAISGMPFGNWTVQRAGVRITRTPSITADDDGRGLPGLGVERERPVGGSLSSSITTTPTETMDWLSPPSSTDYSNQSNFITDWGDGAFVEAISWRNNIEGPQFTWLEPGVAQWSEPRGRALAQGMLLAAGLLLGIAVSVATEMTVEIFRRQDESKTRSRRTPKSRAGRT